MRLRIVHLLSEPQSEREQRSIRSVADIIPFSCGYIQQINAPYEGEIPPAREASDRPFQLTQAHYGCWLAHKTAIEEYLTDDIDALLICECDCLFVEGPEETGDRIERAYRACANYDLDAFTFGPKHGGQTVNDLGDSIVTTTRLIETHCVMVPLSARDRVRELFSLPFDAADYVWTCYGYDQRKYRIGIFDDKIVAVQANGMSLVDKRFKNSEHHFRSIRQN